MLSQSKSSDFSIVQSNSYSKLYFLGLVRLQVDLSPQTEMYPVVQEIDEAIKSK